MINHIDMEYNRLTINATIILLYNYAVFVVFTQQSSKANAANDLKPTYDNVVHGVPLCVSPRPGEYIDPHTLCTAVAAINVLSRSPPVVPHARGTMCDRKGYSAGTGRVSPGWHRIE